MDLRSILPEWISQTGLLSTDCINELLDFPQKYPSGHCVRQFLSRVFGMIIVLGGILIKLPQLVGIWAWQSAQGVSLLAELFMMAATFTAIAYGHLKQFPLSAYGDSYSMFLQTFFIVILILRYHYRSTKFIVAFIAVSACGCYALFVDIIPHQVIVLLNAVGVLLAATSKILQIIVNQRNQSTGQLSMITLMLMLFGSLARIFTSIQETGDWTLIATYTLMTICNAILVFQCGYYWNKPAETEGDEDDRAIKRVKTE
ncbi:hypothetical protein ACOME3_002924 [Neoechinorhynchus agilis]